jgi:capsular exopolysaccharide synthesis family protein
MTAKSPPRPSRALAVRDDAEQPDLQRYLGVLWERRYPLLFLLCAAVGLAVLYGDTQPPIYETRSSILVEASLPHVLGNPADELADPTPANFYMMQDFLQTSRRILTSDSLARRAAARLRLLDSPDFFAPGPPAHTLEEAGEELLDHYTADLIAETRVLVVTARHRQPEWAKKIADAIADEFVIGTAENRELFTQHTAQQLAEELDAVRKSLRESELALFQFKSEHDMLSVSLEDRANQVARQIDKYTDALTEVRLRKLQRQSLLEELRKLKDLDALHVPLSGADMPQLLGDLRRVYAEEQRHLAELRARYEDRHPLVQQQSSKVEQVLRELTREAETAIKAAELRAAESELDEKKVLGELATLKQEGLRINRLEIEYNKLKRDAESFQKQYSLLLNRTKETGMAYRLSLSALKVLDYARLPKVPVSPRKRLIIGLAVLLALLIGLSMAFALDALDRTLKSPEDVERHLGLPLLGRLPSVKGSAGGGKTAVPSTDLYVHNHPRSPLAEGCRALRTNLLFAAVERPLKTVLVTSSVAREGKTLCCISLGITLAQAGARTLLIDCDLRRPRLGKTFGLREGLGLTSVLALDADLDDAVRTTEIPNLEVLPSGPLPPNPAELLDGEGFRRLLLQLAEKYDRVLIDSPPAVPVTDPAVLSTAVDGVLLVVRNKEAHRDLARRAAQHILDVSGNLLGVVLNAVAPDEKRYRAYYGLYTESTDGKHHQPSPV